MSDHDHLTDVSVVIPTLGRSTLHDAISSVARQSLRPAEVIVVNDSETQSPVSAGLPIPVIEVFSGGRVGEPAARNVGIRHAKGRYVAFLDDDDMWLPGHLSRGVAFLDSHPDIDIYSTRAIMIRPDNSVTTTTRTLYQPRWSVMTYFFGRRACLGLRRSISPSTWVVRSRCLDIPMAEDVPRHVDVWWLITQDLAGRRIHQGAHQTVVYFANEQRNVSRHTIDSRLDWARLIESIEKGAGAGYLVGWIGRHYVRSGGSEDFEALVRAFREDVALPIDFRILVSLEILASRVVGKVRRRS